MVPQGFMGGVSLDQITYEVMLRIHKVGHRLGILYVETSCMLGYTRQEELPIVEAAVVGHVLHGPGLRFLKLSQQHLAE